MPILVNGPYDLSKRPDVAERFLASVAAHADLRLHSTKALASHVELHAQRLRGMATGLFSVDRVFGARCLDLALAVIETRSHYVLSYLASKPWDEVPEIMTPRMGKRVEGNGTHKTGKWFGR